MASLASKAGSRGHGQPLAVVGSRRHKTKTPARREKPPRGSGNVVLGRMPEDGWSRSDQRAETADTVTDFAAGCEAIVCVPAVAFVSATQQGDETITGLLTTVQPQRFTQQQASTLR